MLEENIWDEVVAVQGKVAELGSEVDTFYAVATVVILDLKQLSASDIKSYEDGAVITHDENMVYAVTASLTEEIEPSLIKEGFNVWMLTSLLLYSMHFKYIMKPGELSLSEVFSLAEAMISNGVTGDSRILASKTSDTIRIYTLTGGNTAAMRYTIKVTQGD